MESEAVSDGVLLRKQWVAALNVLNEVLFELSHFNQTEHALDAEFLSHPMHQSVELLGALKGLHQLAAEGTALLVVAEHSARPINLFDIHHAVPLPALSDLQRDPERGQQRRHRDGQKQSEYDHGPCLFVADESQNI